MRIFLSLWAYIEKFIIYAPLLLQNRGAKRKVFLHRPIQAPKQHIFPPKVDTKMIFFSIGPPFAHNVFQSLIFKTCSKITNFEQNFRSLSVSMLKVRQEDSDCDLMILLTETFICYICLLKSPLILENTKFIAGELSLKVSFVLYLPTWYYKP